ncbi:Putative LOC101744434, partial [Caligus rogercresseyi]
DHGTCFTSEECADNGGTSDGNCASGFGVCCTFKVSTCGTSVTRNITYITNPSYPTAYTTSGTCTYTINRVNDNICQIRLDFDNLVLTEPATGECSNTNTDKLTFTSPSGYVPPGSGGLCGDNVSGSH